MYMCDIHVLSEFSGLTYCGNCTHL